MNARVTGENARRNSDEMRERLRVDGWCEGSYEDAPRKEFAPCPECGKPFAVVGRDVGAGWGRLRFPRHKAMT